MEAIIWRVLQRKNSSLQRYGRCILQAMHSGIRRRFREDPFWKDNEYRALDLMEKDYEYETVFEGTEAQEGERQWLRFEGLDTICDIYLNEEKIGNTYNMHRIWEFDVTGKVKAGENILRVLW